MPLPVVYARQGQKGTEMVWVVGALIVWLLSYLVCHEAIGQPTLGQFVTMCVQAGLLMLGLGAVLAVAFIVALGGL